MPVTYLIFLARGSGSFFLPAHVGSELGRSLGLSGTAAEFIGARSQCTTWGTRPSFKQCSQLQAICTEDRAGGSRAAATKSTLQQGGKKYKVHRII